MKTLNYDVKALPENHARLTRTVKGHAMEFVPASETYRKPKEKFVEKGLLRVPNDLRRMATASDMLANAQEIKPQATKSVAEQIIALMKHDTKLLEQAEAAKRKGNVARVAALIIQIEANRNRGFELHQELVSKDHSIGTETKVVGYSLMPSISKPLPMGKALPRVEYRKGNPKPISVTKAYPVTAIKP